MDEQWVEEMTKELDRAPDILTAIQLAIGAASMCWENVDRAGVFESNRAGTISELLHRRVTLGAVNWTPGDEDPRCGHSLSDLPA